MAKSLSGTRLVHYERLACRRFGLSRNWTLLYRKGGAEVGPELYYLVTTSLPLLPRRIGCVNICPDEGGVGTLLEHSGFSRCGVGNVRLRGESVSSEYDLSRSLCRSQSDPSLNHRMSRLQLQ